MEVLSRSCESGNNRSHPCVVPQEKFAIVCMYVGASLGKCGAFTHFVFFFLSFVIV